jgi:hypothetical protein
MNEKLKKGGIILLSCPYCAGVDLQIIKSAHRWNILCVDCGAEGSKMDNPISAAKFWNETLDRHASIVCVNLR